jgi:PQQ-like domain
VTSRTRLVLAAISATCAVASCGATSTPSTTPQVSNTTAAAGSPSTTAGGPVRTGNWTTYYQDAGRDGYAADGPLHPDAIHRVWQSPTLDGDVYAEPLFVGNRVIVATANDSVYALSASDGAVVWRSHLGSPVKASALPCGDVDPVGITSTPVVDAAAGRVYAVGLVQGPIHDVLFDLRLSTGALVASKPVDVAGADPKVHNQRSALTLSKGKVYIPYGGRFGDCGDYHGRVVSVAVSASGLGAVTPYTLPTQGEGGFWTPPGAATASDGSMYLASGNSSSTTSYDYGNSVVRLNAGLTLLDSWAPRNWKPLNATDGDVGSSGPVLLPGGRVFQIGKSGIGYLLDAMHLGGIGGELHSGPVCTSSGVWGAIGHRGDTMYVPCSGSVVKVTVKGNSFTVGWSAGVSTPGPTIVTPAAIWTVQTQNGHLLALDPATGNVVANEAIGAVPSRFTTPTAGGGLALVASDQRVSAFGS